MALEQEHFFTSGIELKSEDSIKQIWKKFLPSSVTSFLGPGTHQA